MVIFIKTVGETRGGGVVDVRVGLNILNSYVLRLDSYPHPLHISIVLISMITGLRTILISISIPSIVHAIPFIVT